MKNGTAKLLLLVASIHLTAFAGFEQFSAPFGTMNVFERNGLGPGNYLFFSFWALNDVQALTTDDRTFQLLPNINTYGDGSDPFWADGNGDGNKFMEASTIFEIGSISNEIGAGFSFDVTAFDLDPRYELQGFIKVLDPDTDFSVFAITSADITGTGPVDLSLDLSSSTVGMVLQAGWQMRGLNANPATNWGSATVTATQLFADVGDLTAPSPNPMSFDVEPFALSDQAISMTASTATDASGVEYYFECIAGDGNDSGWQDSPVYIDSGLAPGSNYTYTVKARDKSSNTNETAESAAFLVATQAQDTSAPTPSPMQFAALPGASSVSILLEAVEAVDSAPVQYFFESVSGNGNDSGWQDSRVYLDTGVVSGSNYSYRVLARDLSSGTNVTVASEVVDVVTPPAKEWLVESLMDLSGSTTDELTLFNVNVESLSLGSASDVAQITFDSSGALFGEGEAFQGRNILRTTRNNFADASFEAYATFAFDGANDQSAYIGMGQGIVDADVPGNFGVPELALSGVNGIVGEFKTVSAAGAPNCNMLKIISGSAVTNDLTDPVAENDVFRAKLFYDAGTGMATISVDTNYLGGDFTEDRVLGSFDTSTSPTNSMWDGQPVRVYVGGGEGTVVKDLVVRALPSDVIIDDLSTPGVSGGAIELVWGGSAGQTFEVQYRTDLRFGEWIADPTVSNLYDITGGTISVTSSVDEAKVFFRVVPLQ